MATTTKTSLRIDSIKVVHQYDDCPDTSWIGEYSNNWQEGAIDRQERGDMGRNEHRYFIPATEYGEQDYKQMEALNNGDWHFIGIVVECVVSHPCSDDPRYPDVATSRRLETFTSGGLWGIESDSGDYLEEVAQEQMTELKAHLAAFGIPWNEEMAQNALEKEPEYK